MYILEGLGVFQDTFDEISDFETELKENYESAFESFNDDLPMIVFPKQENYEPIKYANLEHENDFYGHYAEEIPTIRLRTERNFDGKVLFIYLDYFDYIHTIDYIL